MKAATEVQNTISLEQVEKYINHFKERIAPLWFYGFEMDPFSAKFYTIFVFGCHCMISW